MENVFSRQQLLYFKGLYSLYAVLNVLLERLKLLLIRSRNVKVTMRLVPQLNTVAMAMALPFTPAGNISLSTNQVTEIKYSHENMALTIVDIQH